METEIGIGRRPGWRQVSELEKYAAIYDENESVFTAHPYMFEKT